ncbi:MAG: ADOP family duplicated permease, partial [Acidobacteriota bacterium]
MRVRLKTERLAQEIARSRMSQNRWAQKLGIQRGHFSQIVNGKRLYLTPRTRHKLLKGLGLSFDDLFELEPPGQGDFSSSSRWPRRRPLFSTESRRMAKAVLDQPPCGGKPMSDLLQDLRLAARTLSKNPAFTLIVIAVLALGIGANTAIFSIVSGVLLHPLPFPDPDQLVVLWENALDRGLETDTASPANFLDWREQSQVFRNMGAMTQDRMVFSGQGEPERVAGASVSADLLAALGVDPLLGRLFTAQEEVPGQNGVALLSHGFWQRRFGSDPNVEGRVISLNGRPHTLIGVLPPAMRFPEGAEVFVPLVFDFDIPQSRGAHYLQVIARLKPGSSLQQAQAEMNLIASRLQRQYPERNTGRGVAVRPLHQDLVGDVKRPLLVLQGAAFLVLLITCANVANMLLARSGKRGRETALRLALGAGKARIVRLLLTESLLLALLGGAAGVLLAYAGLEWFLALLPQSLPRADNIQMDYWVLGAALLAALTTGTLFGLAPARQATQTDLQAALQEGLTTGRKQLRLRGSLVVAEIALALVLVFGAGLLLHSFWQLQAVEPGFQTSKTLALNLSLPDSRYDSEASVAAFYQGLLERVQADPRITSASAVSWLPPGGTWFFVFDIEGREPFARGEKPSGSFRPATFDYLQMMGIPLLQGRYFTQQDDANAPLAVIVNRTLALRFFPDQDPIGQRLLIGYGSGEILPREIVGVVADIKQFGLGRGAPPAYYVPHRQVPFRSMNIVLRTVGDPAPVAELVRSRVRELDPELAVSNIQTLEQRLYSSLSRPRFISLLSGTFAALALILACLGIYGLMSYSVLQRTGEIAVRMALGARRRDVLRMVLRQGALLLLAGLALGSLGAFAVSRLLASSLFQLSPGDPLTVAAVVLLLSLVALAASYFP